MSWAENIHKQASMVIDQIAAARKLAETNGLDPDELSKPYRKLLDKLYTEELPYAKLLDESDLVVRLQGPAVESDTPNVAIVGSTLQNLKTQLDRLAKAILDPSSNSKVRGFEFDLTGLAKGSLIVGLQVRPERSKQGSLLTANDQAFEAVRSAIRKMAEVSRYIGETSLDETGLRDAIPDPAARDATLIAIHKLTPTGKKGVDSISLINGDTRSDEQLTPASRATLGIAIKRPIRSNEVISLDGVVREIDLDANRFELKLSEKNIRVRCVLSELNAEYAQLWLNRKIRVTGKAEFFGNKPRLIQAERIEVLKEPENGDLFEG